MNASLNCTTTLLFILSSTAVETISTSHSSIRPCENIRKSQQTLKKTQEMCVDFDLLLLQLYLQYYCQPGDDSEVNHSNDVLCYLMVWDGWGWEVNVFIQFISSPPPPPTEFSLIRYYNSLLIPLGPFEQYNT